MGHYLLIQTSIGALYLSTNYSSQQSDDRELCQCICKRRFYHLLYKFHFCLHSRNLAYHNNKCYGGLCSFQVLFQRARPDFLYYDQHADDSPTGDYDTNFFAIEEIRFIEFSMGNYHSACSNPNWCIFGPSIPSDDSEFVHRSGPNGWSKRIAHLFEYHCTISPADHCYNCDLFFHVAME